MRACRFCAHAGPSRTAKSFQLHVGPANTTANTVGRAGALSGLPFGGPRGAPSAQGDSTRSTRDRTDCTSSLASRRVGSSAHAANLGGADPRGFRGGPQPLCANRGERSPVPEPSPAGLFGGHHVRKWLPAKHRRPRARRIVPGLVRRNACEMLAEFCSTLLWQRSGE